MGNATSKKRLIKTDSKYEIVALFIATILVNQTADNTIIREKLSKTSIAFKNIDDFIIAGGQLCRDLNIEYFDDPNEIGKTLTRVFEIQVNETNMEDTLASLSICNRKIGTGGPYGMSIRCLNYERDQAKGKTKVIYLWLGELIPTLIYFIMKYLKFFGKSNYRINVHGRSQFITFGNL